ncbi:DNA mismatch repair protein MutS [Candidatus Bipolaricaulota bacterium]|nr:DNA mismatch repair protein MutS [Candidatus Bipolaricaulota bacterium]
MQLAESTAYTGFMTDVSKQTPMMKQYWRFKAEVPDAILFYHLCDFYETFYEDAQTVSRELDIVLTSRNGHPMAGVPIRRGEAYMQQLLQRGYKVAVCRQVEDPKDAKGLVKRDIVQIITPGTVLDDGLLDAGDNNYLCAVDLAVESGPFGIAFLDLSTGEFIHTLAPTKAALRDELVRRSPSEILVANAQELDPDVILDPFVTRVADSTFAVESTGQFALGEGEPGLRAAGALRAYVAATQKAVLKHIRPLSVYSLADHMDLDPFTVSSLELVKPLREGQHKATLLQILDATSTSMGRRRLRRMILAPLTHLDQIAARLDAVDLLVRNVLLRQQLRQSVGAIHDVERLLGKLGAQRMRPMDLSTLLGSLACVSGIAELLSHGLGEGEHAALRLKAIDDDLAHPQVDALVDEFSGMLVDQPPADAREGGLIRPGYDPELDALREDVRSSRQALTAMERKEREETGISSLKVGYNRVFGYYIEVTRSHLEKVPDHYIRRQTLANAERYITDELQAFEQRIAQSDERAKALEIELFEAALDRMSGEIPQLQVISDAIAELDVYLSLAETAHSYRYVRPTFVEDHALRIRAGRHPVVERIEEFVPNDLDLTRDRDLVILTGPNMAGKSVFLRQNAIICLMAQMGSFVPASEASLPIIDRVFARVGASDMLTAGISTFMMEMLEVSAILRTATSRSLIILDEMGRGTSTFDGVSIAWAVARELATYVKAKTLFATHYQELTRLSDDVVNVENLHVAVKEIGRDIVFLHRVEPGIARGSYGVHVARLAGLPQRVTDAADVILEQLLLEAPLSRLGGSKTVAQPVPLFGSEDHPIIKRLRKLDPNAMTPMESLQILDELKRQAD